MISSLFVFICDEIKIAHIMADCTVIHVEQISKVARSLSNPFVIFEIVKSCKCSSVEKYCGESPFCIQLIEPLIEPRVSSLTIDCDQVGKCISDSLLVDIIGIDV